MSTDSTALIVACISGAVSLAAAGGVEMSRRRNARALQQLSAEQGTKLERLRADQAKELEELRDRLGRSRDAETKSQEAARLVAKYRDPLLRAAYDLQSRIYNIYRPGGFTVDKDREYFRLNTLYLLADLLGWLEIIRREMQFVDLGGVGETKALGLRLARLQDLLANTTEWHDDCFIYRGNQRAIGELMLTRIDGGPGDGRRHETMGYAAFVAAQAKPEFAGWFERWGTRWSVSAVSGRSG